MHDVTLLRITLVIYNIYLAPSADLLTPGGSNIVLSYVGLRTRAYDLALRLHPGVNKSAEVGKEIFQPKLKFKRSSIEVYI